MDNIQKVILIEKKLREYKEKKMSLTRAIISLREVSFGMSEISQLEAKVDLVNDMINTLEQLRMK